MELVYPFEEPPVFYDIGVRYGFESLWASLIQAGHVIGYGFDPDEDHCKTLSNGNGKVLPYALGDKVGKEDFYVTANLGCCSCKEPNHELLEKYPQTKWSFEVTEKTEIETTTINQLVDDGEIPPPNFIKIDVQGFEYEVLKGCDKYLDNVYGIKLETHMQPMYKDEVTFFGIYDYLVNEKGFMLRQLNQNSYYDGEALEFDAFFTRGPLTPDDVYLRDTFFSKIYGLDPPKIGMLSSMFRNKKIPGQEFYKEVGFYQ